MSLGYRGTVIHSLGLKQLAVLRDGLLAVDKTSGNITGLTDLSGDAAATAAALGAVDEVITLGPGRFLIPGFVDGHAHAPQYAFAGLGMSLPLLEWLETYTFPCEAKFKDTTFAERIYQKAVNRHVRNGITTCSWFGSIHLEGTKVLVDVIRAVGQRAHVGKVSMDRNSPDYYIEPTLQGVREVEAFVDYVKQTGVKHADQDGASLAAMGPAHSDSQPLKLPQKRSAGALGAAEEEEEDPKRRPQQARVSPEGQSGGAGSSDDLVTPSVIPRFVPSCTSEMMRELARISREHCLPVHSHLSESVAEIEWVKSLHPEAQTYAQVYQDHGLLHSRSYMAHCVHCWYVSHPHPCAPWSFYA